MKTIEELRNEFEQRMESTGLLEWLTYCNTNNCYLCLHHKHKPEQVKAYINGAWWMFQELNK